MSKQQDEARLGNGNIWSVVLSLAVPTMLAQFVNVLYSIVDRIYIGNMPGIGDTALAGRRHLRSHRHADRLLRQSRRARRARR